MNYFELLGLPSSGKTALLKSFRKFGHQSRNVQVVLSEDIRMIFRRIGLHGWSGRWRGDDDGRSGTLAWLDTRTAFDGWQMGVLSQYPEVLCQVFNCLQAVAPNDRQRAILLNYWRTRLSLFHSVATNSLRPPVLVDEGLSQSAYSTISRMPSSVGQSEERAEALVRSLPASRTVILLRTPISAIQRRTQQAGRAQTERLSLRAQQIATIFETQKSLGVDTFELDGSRGVDQLRIDLQDIVFRAGG